MGWRIFYVVAVLLAVSAFVKADLEGTECSQEDNGTVGRDVTVLVFLKEVPGVKALAKMMKSVPSEVEVLYVAFNPTTPVEVQDEVARIDAAYENFKILPDAPPYSNIGDSRRYVFGGGFVKTKYFLSVENVAFFGLDFIQNIYDKAEAVRAEEQRKGMPTSVSFVPKVLEICDENESMWSRVTNQSHIMFDPVLYRWEPTDTDFFHAGVVEGETLLKFSDDDGDGQGSKRFKEWSTTLPQDRFPETGVPGTRYIHFVEDHVYLAETQFYIDHLDYLSHADSMWKDDHFYLAAVPMFYGRGVVLVNEVASMHWFCDWTLEVLHIIAWRRLEAHMITSCQLQEFTFGVTQLSQNCWAWMNSYKATLFNRITVPDVQEQFEAFRPEASLSSLRNANLILSSFLFSSHTEFRFSSAEEPVEWLWATGALTELDRLLRLARDSADSDRLYVYGRHRYIDVFSEEYQAKGMIPSMPDTYSRLLETKSLPSNFYENLKGGLVLDLPTYRLYHTGPISKADVSSRIFDALSEISFVIVEHVDDQKFDYIARFKCVDCPAALGIMRLVTATEPIRIPAFDGDSNVRVSAFSFREDSL